MRKILLFAVVLLAALAVKAQQTLPATTFSKQSSVASKGTDVQADEQNLSQRHCGTMEHLEWMMQQDPTLEARMQAEEKKFEQYIAEHQYELENSKTTYTMPVVVHVVYNGTSGYVSPSRVTEQITQTNSDWAGTNGRSMGSFSTSLRADCGITLCLATKDPNGNATTGIDYKTTTVSSFGTNDNVKHASTGGADAWDVTKYLNIWVCNLGQSLCGYAQFPTSVDNEFGVVIHYQFFGITGASSPYNGGGTTSHEFGHCFNLYHIWGDDGGSCSGSDNCADTPNQADATYGNHSGVLTDACSSSSPGIMYMNFMDYSDDADYANMTPNQATRMQAAIASYLSGVANNAATACNTGPAAPSANFSANATVVNPGTTVSFTDLSANSPTSWSWSISPSSGWSWAGGSSASSQNPQVLFSTVGSYSVTLTATNSIGSDVETKTNYITVTNGSTQTCDTLHYPLSGTPVLYGSSGMGYVGGNNSYGDIAKADYFDSYSPYTTIYGAYFWFGVATDDGSTSNITFNVWDNSGSAGNPSAVIGTATVPLATIVSNTNSGYMTGVSFTSPVTITGPFYVGCVLPQSAGDTLALITNTDGDTSPGTAWEQWSDNAWYAYSHSSSWGYNVQSGIFPIVCNGPADIAEPGTLESILIYPNPSNGMLNINLINYHKPEVSIGIYNSMGKLIKSLVSESSIMQVDLSDQSAGIYFVSLVSEEGSVIRRVSVIR